MHIYRTQLMHVFAAVSHQFIQSKAEVAVFIQDKEAPLPFLPLTDGKQNHFSTVLFYFFFYGEKKSHSTQFHHVLPSTSASGCQNLSPQEPNTASLHRWVSPVRQKRKWKQDSYWSFCYRFIRYTRL